jgi:heme/copper-type cytochrome/quinol oxidase subunit 2
MLRAYPAPEAGIPYANTRQALPIAIMVMIIAAMIVIVMIVVITVMVVAVSICRSRRRHDRAEQQAQPYCKADQKPLHGCLLINTD